MEKFLLQNTKLYYDNSLKHLMFTQILNCIKKPCGVIDLPYLSTPNDKCLLDFFMDYHNLSLMLSNAQHTDTYSFNV